MAAKSLKVLFVLLLLGNVTQALKAKTDALVVNEIMASNIDSYWSPSVNFDAWIEFYNPTDEPFVLAGCYLSDDKKDLKKWQFPSDFGYVRVNGYRQLWFDHSDDNPLACTFNLDCDGGTLYLSDADGNLILQQKYPEVKYGFSYGRKQDGGDEWGWTDAPSPNKTNSNSGFYEEQCPMPEVPDGCLFKTTYTLEVPIPEGYTLRYTTDGSTPSNTNGLKSKLAKISFKITANKSYRFRLCKEGMLSSYVVTRTFLKDEGYKLPIVSISTKDSYLYDDEIGCTVKGTNGIPGNGVSYNANFNNEWSRPVNFQMIKDGKMVVNQDVNFKVAGGYTRSYNQAFKLTANKKYTPSRYFDYPFFATKPHNHNHCLFFRRGGNDVSTRICDPAIQSIPERAGVDIDLQAYTPVIYYVNGVKKGIANIREPNNKDFANANFGYEEDELEVYNQALVVGGHMMVGTSDVYDMLYQLSKTANTDDESYKKICQYLDVDEYVNYMAYSIYVGRTDWPHNNVKLYRHTPDGRYRAVFYDVEFAFNTDNAFTSCRNANSDKYRHVQMFFNLLKNADFRRRFADAFCVMGGSVCLPKHINPVLDSISALVETDLKKVEGKTTVNQINSYKSKFASWLEPQMINLANEVQLNGELQSLELKCNNAAGRILVDNLPLPYNYFKGQLLPGATIEAVSRKGVKFKYWQETCTEINNCVLYSDEWSYYDKGNVNSTKWKDLTFDDSNWSKGSAPFGYGNRIYSTILNYGDNASDKVRTYYFRKKFTVDKIFDNATVVFKYAIDDGFVMYINGQVAANYNIDPNPAYSTFATTVDTAPVTGTLEIDKSLLKVGENIVAIEVHNCSKTSSDIFWDCSLTMEGTAISTNIYSKNAKITLPNHANMSFVAMYDKDSQLSTFGKLRINEVSAANNIFVNEHFKKSDWIEIYNPTSSVIDINGYYLTNKEYIPDMYRISNQGGTVNTKVPAYGYLTIWCDKLESINQLHSSFNLPAEGGKLILNSKLKNVVDSLTYPPHNGDESFGRYPDGTDSLYIFNIPSFSKENYHTSYMQKVDASSLTSAGIVLADEHNMIDMFSSQDYLILKLNGEPVNVCVEIFNMSGTRLSSLNIELKSGGAMISTSELSEGLYIACLRTADGKIFTHKFKK